MSGRRRKSLARLYAAVTGGEPVPWAEVKRAYRRRGLDGLWEPEPEPLPGQVWYMTEEGGKGRELSDGPPPTSPPPPRG